MAEKDAVDVDRTKASPLGAAEPVEVPAVLGATFAERAAANKKPSGKKVSGDDAENKAVTASESKSRRGRK